MIPITVRPLINDFMTDMGAMRLKQLPYARNWMVNQLAWDIRQGTRNTIQQKLRTSPRGLRFLLNHVRVLNPRSVRGRANLPDGTDGEGRAFVGIIPPGGKGEHAGWSRYRGSLLAMLEAGGRTPGPRDFGGVMGLGRYAIPERRPTDRTPVPMRMFPINLGLQARRSIEGKLTPGQLRGKRRTFLIKRSEGRSTIFQRYGRERDAITPLYHTIPQAHLPGRHYFYPTAQWIVDTRAAMHLQLAMEHALFARGAFRG